MFIPSYPPEIQERVLASERESRNMFIGGMNNRTGSDRENIDADDKRASLMYHLQMDLPKIPRGGVSLVDDDLPDDGLKMRYLSSRDLNEYKTHLVEPTKIANSEDEFQLRVRPIISHPRSLPRVDDKFTLVNFATRDLPDNMQNRTPMFDRDMAYPELLGRHKALPNIDGVSYESLKLSHVTYMPSNYVSSDSWTRGGRNSRQ